MIEWTNTSGSNYVGKLGKYTAFTITWNSMASKVNNNKYVLYCELNGIKPHIGDYSTPEDAMKDAEGKILNHWLKGSGLVVKEK